MDTRSKYELMSPRLHCDLCGAPWVGLTEDGKTRCEQHADEPDQEPTHDWVTGRPLGR